MGKTCFDGFFMSALRYVIKKMYFCDIEIYLLFIKYQSVMKKNSILFGRSLCRL